jgi:hypothetical protein
MRQAQRGKSERKKRESARDVNNLPVGQIPTRITSVCRLQFQAPGDKVLSSAKPFGALINWRMTMTHAALALNPFSLMMEPELVLQTMERSQQLRGLRRHKLRPLDKPLIPYTAEALAARAAYDAAIDAEDFEDNAESYLLN